MPVATQVGQPGAPFSKTRNSGNAMVRPRPPAKPGRGAPISPHRPAPVRVTRGARGMIDPGDGAGRLRGQPATQCHPRATGERPTAPHRIGLRGGANQICFSGI
jgi:hypothetical protein